MKTATAFFLGLGTSAMLTAAVALATVPRPAAWLDAARGPQISGLNATQQATLDQLRTATQAQRRDAHARIGALLDTAVEELSRPDADLQALSAEAEATLLPLLLDARAKRQQKLAFYNELNAAQQAEVRAWMQQRLTRAKRLHAVVGDFLNDNP